MTASSLSAPAAPDGTDPFLQRVADLRPRLHRYCARMTGSAVDGDDVVQEALIKAFEALAHTRLSGSLEGWLFRIAHNAAMDFLRRRGRHEALHAPQDVEAEGAPDEAAAADGRVAAASGLRTFMRLPPLQRSTVVLMDVLGYSLDEIVDITQASLPSVKAALHRGRLALQALAAQPPDAPPVRLDDAQRALLERYIERFNAHDFDAIRDMLADEVKLYLAGRRTLQGRAAVSGYFHNYQGIGGWRLALGQADGRAAVLVDTGEEGPQPAYFVLLDWAGDRLVGIRDFRYARHVAQAADLAPLPGR
jgi:RNA polymerase sigma-70 factor (ECF subfamily)